MTEYLIFFNQQWVGDHPEEWYGTRGPLAMAVVNEMKEAGVYVFAGGLVEEVDEAFSADANSGTLLFTDHQVMLGAHTVVKPGSTHLVNAPVQPDIPLVVVPSVDGSGYTLEAAIPWSVLDIKPAENTQLLFDLAIDDAPPDHIRTRQLMWNGADLNSVDRSYWGRLTLVP